MPLGRFRPARRCPWCLERQPWPAPAGPGCTRCGRALEVEGQAVRPIDLRDEAVAREQRSRYLRWLRVGAPAAAVLGLVLQPFHPVALGLAPVLATAHLLAVRLFLVREAYGLLGPARRRFHRWMLRLSFLWLGVPGWGLAAVPVAGVAATAFIFAGLTTFAHQYTLRALDRERRRVPLDAGEKLVVAALAVLTLAAAVLVASMAGLAWWAFEKVRTTWP